MFKRVEKRRRKKVEEEELGIDEDMKEILGMHDTDSEESDSDSDQAESSVGDVDEEQQGLSETDSLRKGWDSDQEEDAEEHVITVQEALRDPVYLVSLQPDVKACIVCPGKHLKGARMAELHRTSKACTLPLFLACDWTYLSLPSIPLGARTTRWAVQGDSGGGQ
jgi:hypothetical protein